MSTYFSRQPIFDVYNNTYGYEILYRENLPEEEDEDYYAPERIKERDNEFCKKIIEITAKKMIFIGFSPEQYIRKLPRSMSNKNIIIEVSPEELGNLSVLESCFQLKRQGYTICVKNFLYDETQKELYKFANIIKLDMKSDRERIISTVEHCINDDKLVIADNVQDFDTYEYAKDIGCTFIQGYFFAQPVAITKRSGGPMIRTFLQILALVYSPEPDIEHIAAIISTDPVLTIRLLRLINQLCADTGNTVSTVHQALVMLGLDKLKEWVYLVGLQRLNRNAPDELLKLALLRARFCERIARVSPNVGMRGKELYLMGLISIVTGTSGSALADALDDLPISEEIKAGLRGEGGIFSDIYDVASAYESGDWESVDEFTELYGIESQYISNEYIAAMHFLKKFVKIS